MQEIIRPDFTVGDVAALLAISNPTVYRLIHTQQLQSYKVGRGTRITRESVEAFREGRTIGGAA